MVRRDEMNRLKELSTIIRDYRKGELPISLDEKHIEKWLNQFDSNIQDDIISETLYILRNWYFNSQSFVQFGNEVIEFLKKQYCLNDLYFFNNQLHGKSQAKIIHLLEKNGIINEYLLNNTKSNHYVYLDDGLYTGNTITEDIECILENHILNTIDVFVFLAYSYGYDTLRKSLSELGEKHNTQINVYRFKELQNTKKVKTLSNGGEMYFNDQDTLWSQQNAFLSNPQIINEYIDLFDKKTYLFRSITRSYTSRIFSSDKARKVLEAAFLEKGVEIVKSSNSNKKGLFPLGYNNFGSICVFEFNISNTCPLVLWWGNLIKQGNALDIWYPLLPRRIE